jgi:drug/metabolite transporter (DMT)-like permease
VGLDVRRGAGCDLVYGVIPFLAVRFVLAAAALTPIYAAKLTRRSLIVGGGIGVVLAAGYVFQTTGLLFTTPTNSGLITGLFVVFAPLADRLLFGANLSRQVVLAVALSLVGIVLLTGGGPEGANWGDLLTLLCAAALGLHIALLSRFAASHDAGALTLAQILSIALLFLIVWPFESARRLSILCALTLRHRDRKASIYNLRWRKRTRARRPDIDAQLHTPGGQVSRLTNPG